MRQIRLWMMAAILACGAMTVNAQESESEFAISYGLGSNSTIMSFLEDLTSVTLSSGSVRYDNDKVVGPIAMEYFYHVSPKIGIGSVVAFVNTKKDLMTGNTPVGTAKVNYLSVLPALKLGWFDREHFGMYSKLAAGVTFRHDKQEYTDNNQAKVDTQNKVTFNFQASIVGIEAGGTNFRGFAELGVGEQGIFLAGLRYKF